jgi:hypothetical protein
VDTKPVRGTWLRGWSCQDLVGSCPRPCSLANLNPWQAQQLDTLPRKATRLLAILQRRGADVLYSIPAPMMHPLTWVSLA